MKKINIYYLWKDLNDKLSSYKYKIINVAYI